MKTSFLIILIFIVIVSGCGFKNYEDAENFLQKNEQSLLEIERDFQTLPGLEWIRHYSGDWPTGKLNKKYEIFRDLYKYEIRYKENFFYLFLNSSKLENIQELTLNDYLAPEDSSKKFSDFVSEDSLNVKLLNSIVDRIYKLHIIKLTKTYSSYTLFYLDGLNGLAYKSNPYALSLSEFRFIQNKKIKERWYYFREKF